MTYQPTVPRPDNGWPDDLTTVNHHGATHIQDTNGDTWKVFAVNKKSVSIDQSNVPNKTRVATNQLNSFDTIQQPPTGHADRAHALLSASGANRWIHCTPSAIIEQRYPDTTSDAADQGTAAHELAEHKLRLAQNQPTTRPESQWHDEEMEDHTDSYVDNVMAELTRAQQINPAAFLSIEERLDFSHIVPDGFGTGDAIIVGDDTLTIVDLKYGKGVKVDAENNPQMSLYALGALRTYGMIYNITNVRMVIFQPRLNNISVWETTPENLAAWAHDTVTPAATTAAQGKGELTAGEWCTFCKHAPLCPALATQHFTPVPTTPDGTPAAPAPDTLTDEQIATIVAHSGELKKWLGKVEKHALDKANDGYHWPGLKLVEGRSIRRFTNTDAVAKAVEQAGHDPYKHTLLGLTDLTKLLGKNQFDTLLGKFIEKPMGKPTLVPESDKRPELSTATAENVFPSIDKETS